MSYPKMFVLMILIMVGLYFFGKQLDERDQCEADGGVWVQQSRYNYTCVAPFTPTPTERQEG